MKTPFRQFLLSAALVVSLGVMAILAPIVSYAHVEQGQVAAPPAPADAGAVTDGPSLHNPTFDNGYWYEFNKRHDPTYPDGVWLPDGNWYTPPEDPPAQRDIQDWRLWFKHGTDIVLSNANDDHVHSGTHSVMMWTPGDFAHQVAGIYQLIENTTPCFTYKFQMYGYSRQKEASDNLNDMKVGIEQKGWLLNPDHAPAVQDADWPATMVWGTSHPEYESGFGLLEVSAEALDTQITVFTYADAVDGSSSKIHWDTGSLQEIPLTELISDPENPGGDDSGIIFGPDVTASDTSVRVEWNTSGMALSQVFYRLASSPSTPISPTGTLLFAIYLPLVRRGPNVWSWTALDLTPKTSHLAIISGLLPGRTYEYYVVSRGASISGDACVNWVSARKKFTTDTTQ
jgi:hypothetical protein